MNFGFERSQFPGIFDPRTNLVSEKRGQIGSFFLLAERERKLRSIAQVGGIFPSLTHFTRTKRGDDDKFSGPEK